METPGREATDGLDPGVADEPAGLLLGGHLGSSVSRQNVGILRPLIGSKNRLQYRTLL